MSDLIIELVPIAVTIAANPPAVIAVVLMLSADASGKGAASFLGGWLVGLSIVAIAAMLVGDAVGADSQSSMAATAFKALIAAGLLAAAATKWLRRDTSGDVERMPAWMRSVADLPAGRSFGLAAAYAGLNPKTLALNIAGAIIIAETIDGVAAQAVWLALFIVLSSITLVVPLVVVIAVPDRSQGVLAKMQRWLIVYADTIAAVVLGVLGVAVAVSAAQQYVVIRGGL